MLETNKYSVINIRRYLNSNNPKLGENKLCVIWLRRAYSRQNRRMGQ